MTDRNCGFLTRTNFDNSLTITNNVDLKEKILKLKLLLKKEVSPESLVVIEIKLIFPCNKIKKFNSVFIRFHFNHIFYFRKI